VKLAAADEAAAATTAVNFDEELANKFRLVTLALQRARQLKDGARPRVEPGGHKILRVALLEVMAGTVSWSVT
jgi:DNA-directed RNA polymerase omega subunit